MDKRIKYLIGLDTETCNGIATDKGLDLSQSLVYDIGWAITDKRGNIYKTRSFIVREVFYGMSDLMDTCYYAEKLPRYKEDIINGTRIVANFFTIRNAFIEDMKEYNINTVFAHNARFDVNALNNTIRYITKSRLRYFFPHNIEIWDTLKMAKVIAMQKGYRTFCEANGLMTKHKTPRVKMTAEVLYRYIIGNTEFTESHTALEDVLIEVLILKQCFKQHKAMVKKLW